MRTRIKICGITKPQDGVFAAACGADAIGLVFYEKSVRHVPIAAARQIVQSLPPFVSSVGLFVNAEPSLIKSVLSAMTLDVLQFHGNETAEECRAYGAPYIKAVAMGDDVDLNRLMHDYADASALLLDSHSSGKAGGTGEVFDWSRAAGEFSLPIILAGGLDSANVGAAIAKVRPYAVDVSSGVESARGVKSPERTREFIQEVKRADNEYGKSANP